MGAWVGVGEFVVELGEGAGFGGVDGDGDELVVQLPCSGGEWDGPVVEGAVCLVEAGEFGVFDDVGPVLEDPVTSAVLGGERLADGVVEVGGVQLAGVEGVEDAGLIWRGGGEDGVEFVEPLADLRRR